ncbi:MAG: hypothetical protein V4684_04360 [Pseudomonadota bacterium]
MTTPKSKAAPSTAATLSMDTRSRVATVGQLLIRAAAELQKVPPEELAELEKIVGGPLPAGVRTLLDAALKIDPSLAAPIRMLDKN